MARAGRKRSGPRRIECDSCVSPCAAKIAGSYPSCQSFDAPPRFGAPTHYPCTGVLFGAGHRHAEAAVNPRMALEVLRNGTGADILDAQVRERFRVELET